MSLRVKIAIRRFNEGKISGRWERKLDELLRPDKPISEEPYISQELTPWSEDQIEDFIRDHSPAVVRMGKLPRGEGKMYFDLPPFKNRKVPKRVKIQGTVR